MISSPDLMVIPYTEFHMYGWKEEISHVGMKGLLCCTMPGTTITL